MPSLLELIVLGLGCFLDASPAATGLVDRADRHTFGFGQESSHSLTLWHIRGESGRSGSSLSSLPVIVAIFLSTLRCRHCADPFLLTCISFVLMTT